MSTLSHVWFTCDTLCIEKREFILDRMTVIARQHRIVRLQLSVMSFSSCNAAHFAALDMRGLVHLDLHSNDIQCHGVLSLGAGLRRCPALEYLDLSSNFLGDDGATSLAVTL